jgi:NAD(P)-dependent dehydrogenase (short-subunit alcohol dehydrogenase family)
MKAVSNEDRVWLVTGASSGFGRAISVEVLERGHRLVATSRDPERLRELMQRDPERVLALGLDVTDPAAARRAVDRAVSHFGQLDVVVNNAGYGHVGAVEELTDDDVRQQLAVNLLGVINVTRAALPHMRRQRAGHLVQMSSLNGVEGLAGGATYAASKFAIEGWSESLAEEVAPFGIDVTIVEPGPHRTNFLHQGSVKWAAEIPDYADTAGAVRKMLREMDGAQPGDPARAASAIMAAVEASEPPLRLPLGKMALDHIRARLRAQLDELDAWAEIGATSDFPDDSAEKPGRRAAGSK